MKKTLFPLLLILALLFTGCGSNGTSDAAESSASVAAEVTEAASAPAENNETAELTETVQEEEIISEYFSNRDFKTDYDESESARITLSGDSASCDSNAVEISGSTVTILDEGTYILSGTLDDGMIIVNTEKEDKTQLVLDGVSIHSETSAAIYILQSDKVFITLPEGSENTLSSGETYTAIDENNIDAAIYSKEDLTLNGFGSLTVTAPGGHGIVSKDSLTITGGIYDISSASHALSGKDDLCIADGSFTLTSGKDGIHAENADDTTLGFVYIENGTYTIAAEGDGISGEAYVEILDGTFDIVSGGGSENAEVQTSQGWGGFPGGGRGGPWGGAMPGMTGATETTETEEDSTSIKGIKATGDLTISGGTFTIDSADDAIHANTSVTVSGGTYEIASGDDGFHADENLTITGGIINITTSYEGLEGLHVDISDGEISLVASDDGINAAGGTDQSGFAGPRGPDMFGGGGSGTIVISGGSVYLNASGDGLDANGTLEITGGYVVVCGPTFGDTAVLDYESGASISGDAVFVGTGSTMMAQTFRETEHGLISIRTGTQTAGTTLTVTDSQGNTVLTITPELDYALLIYSGPELVKGETYTITAGESTGEFQAT